MSTYHRPILDASPTGVNADRVPLLRKLLRVAVRLVIGADCAGTVAACDLPALFVSNHGKAVDALVLSLFLPCEVVIVLPQEDLRNRWLRWLVKLRPHLIAEMSDPATVKRVLRLLAAGRSVVVYPQGRQFEQRAVMKTYEVPALIAAKTRIPVVPVHVAYQKGWRPRVQVRVDAPHTVAGGIGARAARDRRAQASGELRRLMEATAFHARPRHSLFEAFLDAQREHGPRTRIIEDLKEQPRTYREVLKGALAIGRWADRHTRRGENVGVLLPNAIPTVCTVLGLSGFGRVPAMLNYSSGPAAVQNACAAACVRTVITSRAFIEQARLAPIVAALADLRLLYLEDVRTQLKLVDKLWLVGAMCWPRKVVEAGNGNRAAVVVFTSGSEAHPKGVVLTHEAILANITQMATVIDFTPQDKVLNPLPVYHSYSFTAGMMLCLLTGTKLFLYVSPLRYRAIPEIAYRRNCTYLFGTSTFLSYYAQHADPLDFYSIRRVISGGEKLGADVARIWEEKFGLRIYQGYGATECAPVIALSTPDCFKPGTVGRLLPGLEYRIEPVEGIERGGILHLKGAQVMAGYYRRERPGVIDPPRSRFGDGWYNTGDIIDIDQDGILTVVGRVKRFAKIAGEMISLDIIEEVARIASPLERHAAILRTEAASGETTVLFTTDAKLSRPQLVRAARQSGRPELAAAKHIVWMPDIPVLATGKTDYVALETNIVAANAPDAGPDNDDSASGSVSGPA